MDGLDLSILSDDQLVALARACCDEALRRNPAVGEAMREMMLDETERRRVAEAVTARAAAAARALERERLAAEASAAARARTAADEARARAEHAREVQRLAEAQDRAILTAAANLVGRPPAEISILSYVHRDGQTITHVNEGHERWARDHLASYDHRSRKAVVRRPLMPQRAQLIDLCIGAVAALGRRFYLDGADYDWSE